MRLPLALVLVAACWTSPSSPSPSPASSPAGGSAAERTVTPPDQSPSGLAEAEGPPSHSVWRGTYRCAQGVTAVQLTIDVTATGGADAIFDFGPHPQNPSLPGGSYRLTGAFEDRRTHLEARFVPDKWILQPPNYVMVGFEATTLDPTRRQLRGTIDDPACGRLEVVRVD